MEWFAAGVRGSQRTLLLSQSEFPLDKGRLLYSFAMPCEEATAFNLEM